MATTTPVAPLVLEDERAAILRAATEYVRQEGAVERFTLEIEALEDGFARLAVVPEPGVTDRATLFMRRGDGQWQGVALGTDFPPESLEELGIPPGLWLP